MNRGASELAPAANRGLTPAGPPEPGARVALEPLAFLGRLEPQAHSVGFSDPPAPVRAPDRDFHIRAAPPAPP